MRYVTIQKHENEYWIVAQPCNPGAELVKVDLVSARVILNACDTVAWDLPNELKDCNVMLVENIVRKYNSFMTFSDIAWNTLQQNRYVGSSKQIYENIKKGQETTVRQYMERDVNLLQQLHEFMNLTGYLLGPLVPHDHAMLGTSDIVVKMVVNYG